MKIIEVVAAVIIHDCKILCVQRNKNKYEYLSFKYEFPGGKVEQGETKEGALKREIKEELNLEINIQNYYLTVHHTYPDFKLTMHSFLCSCLNTTIELSEHVDFKWLTKDKINTLDWAAADIPIVKQIMSI